MSEVLYWPTWEDWYDFGSYPQATKKFLTNFNLAYLGKTIENPEPKFSQIEVPFRDGVIDLTDAIGGLHFGMRDIEMRFELMCGRWDFDTYRSRIWNALHGRAGVIKLPDDTASLWQGRLEVTEFKDNKSTGSVTIVLHAQPYRLYGATETSLYDTMFNPNTGLSSTTVTFSSNYTMNWFMVYTSCNTGSFNLPVYIDGKLHYFPVSSTGKYYMTSDLWLEPGAHTFEVPATTVTATTANFEILSFGGSL